MAEQIQNALTILRRRQVEKRVNPRRRLNPIYVHLSATNQNRQEFRAYSMPTRHPRRWLLDWRITGHPVAWYLPRAGLFSVHMVWGRIQSCEIWRC